MTTAPVHIPAPLQPYIRDVWVIDPQHSGTGRPEFSFFADGYPGLFFYESDTSWIYNEGEKKLANTFLYGQTVKPVLLSGSSPCKAIVVIFYPHVLKTLFRISASEVTDDCIDLDLLPAAPRVNITERLWNMPSTEKQMAMLFQYVYNLIGKNRLYIDKGLQFATTQILGAGGLLPLKQLQVQLNLSERTFERKFEEHIGISPKLYSKIVQFQASLNQLKSGKFNKLSDIAYENGYADQSHFIRSFKKFTGLSPLEFKKQLSGLIEELEAP